MFCYCFSCWVVLFPFQKWSWNVLCVCVVFLTQDSIVFCLHFVVFGLSFFYEFLLFTHRKRTRQKLWKPKFWCKNAEITPKIFFQLAQLCSQIVFLIIWGGLQHAKHFYQSGFGKHQKNNNNNTNNNNNNNNNTSDHQLSKFKVKNWSQRKSTIGLSILRNIHGPVFDLWKMVNFKHVGAFCWNFHSPRRKNNIFKKQNSKNLDQFLTYKKIGPTFDSTACICVFVFVYVWQRPQKWTVFLPQNFKKRRENNIKKSGQNLTPKFWPNNFLSNPFFVLFFHPLLHFSFVYCSLNFYVFPPLLSSSDSRSSLLGSLDSVVRFQLQLPALS